MNLVDSCGWLEYFAEGPNASFFGEAIEDVDRLLVPTICLLEVFKRIFQQRGESAALRAVTHMQEGRVVSLDTATALTAARISADMKLPLADSVILATARAHDAVVWTQDAHFESVPGVQYNAKR
ncbi:MAG: type II toxin-antitoxin system VapC family toxin [Firmicutes bacterium]|nr:type II toxin-antitoxin system VapC family toxin [Bacillota bacterium]